MAFEKEHLKLGGRKKGTPNKLKPVDKNLLDAFVNREIKKIPKLVKDLLPKERLDFLAKIIPYVKPKKQEISIDKEIQSLLFHIDKLDEYQLTRLKEIIMDCIVNKDMNDG